MVGEGGAYPCMKCLTPWSSEKIVGDIDYIRRMTLDA